MSTPNGLLSQKVCHYLDQGNTLNDILWRAAHCMTCFDLSKLKFSWNKYTESVPILTATVNRHDKAALRTTCIKNDKFKMIKTRTGCQYVGYFYHSENINKAAQNSLLGCSGPRVGHSCLRRYLLNFIACFRYKMLLI